MHTIKNRIILAYSETARWFAMRHRDQSINLEMLRNELNKACSNGTKPDLETLQEARDIIEALLLESPAAIQYNHVYQSYEIKKEK